MAAISVPWPPPTSTTSTMTPARTMARLAWAMAAWNAVGRMHWLPTWKETPMRSWVARRAASSRPGASWTSAPNLPDSE